MSIVLDNAATSGTLVISGPTSGVANFNVPATDAIASKSAMVFDIITGKFILEVLPPEVVIPTNVSEFTNDAGYQTASDVAAATANFQTAAQVAAAVAPKADTASLSAVAFSGEYSDLLNPATLVDLVVSLLPHWVKPTAWLLWMVLARFLPRSCQPTWTKCKNLLTLLPCLSLALPASSM